jgi:putative glutamine amidotransferase
MWPEYHPFNTINKFVDFAVADSAEDIKENDTLVVWGGGDIHPSLYGKGRSRFSDAYVMPSWRDKAEWDMMLRCREMGNNIIGVCRGAQMLCALAGGILAQHVHGHAGPSHSVSTFDGHKFMVNSIHHQMMFPKDTEHNLVAWSTEKKSQEYHDDIGTLEVTIEPEFVHFPAVKGFAIQWHPEAINKEHPSSQYINSFISERL